MKITYEKGFAEIVLQENCDFATFYHVANEMEIKLSIEYVKKVNDFDSLYWDFMFDRSKFTLHYNSFLGVSIFPTSLKQGTSEDEVALDKLRRELLDLDLNLNYS